MSTTVKRSQGFPSVGTQSEDPANLKEEPSTTVIADRSSQLHWAQRSLQNDRPTNLPEALGGLGQLGS
jgi:hypothetical protein